MSGSAKLLGCLERGGVLEIQLRKLRESKVSLLTTGKNVSNETHIMGVKKS